MQVYYSLEVEPRYAVLIKGDWGIGKTFFIKRSIGELDLPEVKKSLYVSLYGISNFSQVKDEFFCQLHPFLGSKKVKKAYSFVKGIIHSVLKIDIDGDKKEDLFINVKTPDLNIFGDVSKKSDLVLFFDDVERCDIPINQLFGYINQFVEKHGFKVVLIANEDEILKKSSEDKIKDYKVIKEKLIGKTFEVESCFDEAIDFFIDEIKDEKSICFFREQINEIKKIYYFSNYKNLRFLRQVLMDFSAIIKTLDQPVLEKKEFLLQFFTIYTIFSIEIKSGVFSAQDVFNIKSDCFTEKDKRKFTFFDKYDSAHREIILYFDEIVSCDAWAELFSTGLLDAEKINIEMKKSRFFCPENFAPWKKLWHLDDLSDDEFLELREKVSEEFFSKKILLKEINKHVFGILLCLSEENLFKKSGQEIFDMAKLNLIRISTDSEFLKTISKDKVDYYLRNQSGYDGLGYSAKNNKFFRLFEDEERKILQSSLKSSYLIQAKELLGKMKEDFSCFYSSLVSSPGSTSEYARVPIMKFLDPNDFVDAVTKLSVKNIKELTYSFFDDRYSSHISNVLKDEADWLGNVAKKFDDLKEKYQNQLFGYRLSELSKKCFEAQRKLEKIDTPN